jgi:hypothetical protein
MAKITSKEIQEAVSKINAFIQDLYKDKFNPFDKKLIKNNGLKLLGAGVYRVAYRYKNLVIKIHQNMYNSEDIIDEVYSWEKVRKFRLNSIKALFNPILTHGRVEVNVDDEKHYHYYSISPLVTPLMGNKNKTDKIYKLARNFADILFCDSHCGNYGIVNGMPVIIDYQDHDLEMVKNNIFNYIHTDKKVVAQVKSKLTSHYKFMKKLATVAA